MIEIKEGQVWKTNEGKHLLRVVCSTGSNQYRFKYEYLNFIEKMAEKIPKYGWANRHFFNARCTLVKAYDTPLWKALNN
jgi:hypothetical protein